MKDVNSMTGFEIITHKLNEDCVLLDVTESYEDYLNEKYPIPELDNPFKPVQKISDYLKETQNAEYMIGFSEFVEEDFIKWDDQYWLKNSFYEVIDGLIDEYNEKINLIESEIEEFNLKLDDAENEENEELFVDAQDQIKSLEIEKEKNEKILKEIKGEKI